ncbi:MAG: hypothetical protein Q9182_005837 [Xanthomendoza sp. 2 TL-2023]
MVNHQDLDKFDRLNYRLDLILEAFEKKELSPLSQPTRLPNPAELRLKQEKNAEKAAQQLEQARLAQQAENLRLEQARIAHQRQRALNARQKAFAEINQIQAAFRFRHPHECKRYPERFSSNTKLHQHIEACHTKKAIEKSPASSLPPTPALSPSIIENTAQITPETPITSPETPAPAPPIEKTPLLPAKPASPSPQTPAPTPTTPAEKPAQITVKLPSTSPSKIYLPPHKRTYMTINQLFKKFGSIWKATAYSVHIQPIRSLDPRAPVWLPAKASKTSQSDTSFINCASTSAFSTIPTAPPSSLPRKPPGQHPSAQSYWLITSPTPWSSRKRLGIWNTWNIQGNGIIEALLHTLLRLLGGDNGHGYYGPRIV